MDDMTDDAFVDTVLDELNAGIERKQWLYSMLSQYRSDMISEARKRVSQRLDDLIEEAMK